LRLGGLLRRDCRIVRAVRGSGRFHFPDLRVSLPGKGLRSGRAPAATRKSAAWGRNAGRGLPDRPTGGRVRAKALRLRRIFGADGRVLLVAMDHAGFMGPVPGLDLETIAKVVNAGADAVMTTYGTARRAAL